ncbi:MAG: ShlB/FhaC/HecB family hemolysin secretion/activation protein [Waterburya sp.]
MTLSSSKLIRQVTFRYKSQINSTKRHKIISILRQLSFSLICSVALFPADVVAQITPDGTAPTTVEQLEEIMRINGGEREGNNLFHSFDEFSIPEGMEAIFENSTEIENIFTRVTGESVSNIDGILSTQGDANFFFINPNGIVFGDNASLNVGGSFIASSAESIQFENGSEFSATNPEQPILDLSGFPTGLGLGNNPGAITVNGDGQGIRDTPEPIDTISGLRVQSDETLALVGGEVKLDGGTLKTAGGRIELGSVSSGLVRLQSIDKGIILSYENISSLEDIQLSNSAAVDASGNGGGDIQVTSKNLTLLNGGQIVADTLGNQSGGTLSINASETIEMVGIPGNADSFNNTQISTETVKDATGAGGNIKINTGNLILRDEAQITASINGSGDAGSVDILARDSIEIIGKSSPTESFFGSAISTAVADEEATGVGGNLTIETERLTIRDGGIISVDTFGQGSAGNLFVKATDSIELIGKLPDGFLPSSLSALTQGSGNGGNISVETGKLSIQDEAAIAVSSEEPGTGEAGTISINAEDINLDNFGSITAATASGNGGDINIDTDLLQLDNESQITTEAGNEGDGGNITINTSNLTAKKNSNLTTSAVGGDGGNISFTADTILGLENSDITANAVGGNGGNITINTDLIYGYEPRSEVTPFEDITASSELGIDGEITINSPETSIDEDITFSALKIEPRDYKKLLKGSCLDDNRPGRELFNYAGGGIPETPDDYIYRDDPEDYAPVIKKPIPEQANNTPPIWQPGDPIIPANAVEVRNGRKFLVAVNQMSNGSSICDLKPENASPNARIQLQKIKITGNKVFSDDQLKNIIPVIEGSTVTIEDIFRIQSKLTNYYFNQGYASSGAFIASQETTGGVVEVIVVEGILAEAEIKGLSRFQRSYFINRLPIGKPLKIPQLLTILTKFRNNPLIDDLEAKLVRLSPETSRLAISVKEKNPLQTQVSASNTFSPSVGTYGIDANLNYHLLGNGDILNFGYSRTVKDGLIRYEAGYTLPINKYDGTINVNYTDAETNIVEEPTSALDIQANFKSYQFTARQPINLSRGEQLFVELGLEHIQSETFIDNDFSFAFTEGLPDGESKLTALRLATEYIKKGETSALLLRSQFSLGIDLLDATVTNAGIDGLFWSWQGKAQWLKELDDDLILASNLDIQLTPDKLLPIEQISVGGANSVRGYRQNLSIGDNGVIGSVELQIPLFEFLRFDDGVVKINPFIDGGGIWNNQDENIEDSTLLSFGAGVSLEIAEVLNARVDYGIPLIESDLPDDFDDGEKLTFSLVVTP